MDFLNGGPGLRPTAYGLHPGYGVASDFVARMEQRGIREEEPRWIFSTFAPDSGLQPTSGLQSQY